jgi:CRISPR-associated exonuclease Cas4
MAFDETEYVMLSALQHFVFCPRQCALIHIEQSWTENIYTLRGLRVHENVHTPGDESIEEGIRVERSLPLYSHKLGLKGISDVVEFLSDGRPYPVEYKAGSKKGRDADNVQLCAQALCLEEMMGCDIPAGAIFHHGSRRRREVRFDLPLRQLTLQTILDTRAMLQVQHLPPPVNDPRCEDCSLIETCMPEAVKQFESVARRQYLFEVTEE